MSSLPLELERLIFETAVLQDTNHNSRVRIILVAKRVYEWIRPILYRAVAFVDRDLGLRKTSGTLHIHRDNWPSAQIINSAQFVRHFLVISVILPTHEFLEIMSIFPNIENLAILGAINISSELAQMDDLSLRMLSIDITMAEIQGFPVLQQLTHLEILDLMEPTWGACKVLSELPKLTHLCFITSDSVVDALLLKNCASLRVLISLGGTSVKAAERNTTLDDPRYLAFVGPMTLHDWVGGWERSANGLVGCWELAEMIVEARKAKLFKDNSSFSFSRKTWMDQLNDDGMRWYEGFRNGV